MKSSILLTLAALTLTGCFSSSEVSNKNEASVGRQLTELEHARQQGIVTQKEYEKLKKAIIKKNS
jgi:uncharacterized protein YcfL